MVDILDEIAKSWEELGVFWRGQSDNVHLIYTFLLYVIFLFVTLNLTRILMNRYRKNLSETTYHSLRTLVRMTTILIFGVAFLNQFEQFQGSLLGLTALLGTAIGFASTQSVGNMISGIYLMLSRPFYIGDYVILPKLGFEGVVREITINYTKIALPNGTSTIITNKSILNTPVTNTRLEILVKEGSREEDSDNSESFDSQSMEDELRQFFRKIQPKKSIVYVYPINFSVSVDKNQEKVNQAVIKLEKYLEQNVEGVKDMSWRMLSLSRLDVNYELNIMVENSYHIFRIVSTALNKLEMFLEEIK